MDLMIDYFSYLLIDLMAYLLEEELSDDVSDAAFNYRGDDLLLDLTGCIDADL